MAPIQPITGWHSLFATSSAPYVMAVAYASVAASLQTWRRVGFTSFPPAPTSWRTGNGVRDVLSAGCIAGNESRAMKRDSKHLTVLVTAPRLPGTQELAASLSRQFGRTFSFRFPIPSSPCILDQSCSNHRPLSRGVCVLTHRMFIRSSAPPNYFGSTCGRGHAVPSVVPENKTPGMASRCW